MNLTLWKHHDTDYAVWAALNDEHDPPFECSESFVVGCGATPEAAIENARHTLTEGIAALASLTVQIDDRPAPAPVDF
jgi:hypothetical protein